VALEHFPRKSNQGCSQRTETRNVCQVSRAGDKERQPPSSHPLAQTGRQAFGCREGRKGIGAGRFPMSRTSEGSGKEVHMIVGQKLWDFWWTDIRLVTPIDLLSFVRWGSYSTDSSRRQREPNKAFLALRKFRLISKSMLVFSTCAGSIPNG